ncbi:MAG: ABC transporter ATP-binding protein [Candidatus Abyssobacteria bacterium SURF_5]|uniref:ABC transporter ATP-binding protein n=1 Tax=Abyssobacteria bacterium (strain SURF_5) TaxID=2093360 RepID=A0A3A4NC93_ABYX5|nr:MAG: ABC transporter ATP-binding protein [Candidatus Abyssubacteria bacterium SURF_5]
MLSLPKFVKWRKSAAGVVKRFWPQARKQLLLIVTAGVAMVFEILLRILQPWPLKFVFDGVIHSAPGRDAFPLAGACIAVVVITGLRAAVSYISTVSLALAGNRVLSEVRRKVYHHLLRLSLSYHDKAKSGDLITRVTGDIGRLQDVAVTAALPLLVHSLTLAGMLGMMFWINWKLALVALSALPFASLSFIRLTGRIREAARIQRKREGKMAAAAGEALAAIKVVKAFALEKVLEDDFSRQNKSSLREGVRTTRLSARLERSVDLFTAVGTALVLWVGARLVIDGSLTAGDLIVYMAYLRSAFRPMQDLAKYTSRIAKATAAGERVLDVLDAKPDISDLPEAVAAPAFRGAVRFDNVTFQYVPGHYVLKDISFEIEAGRQIALVGPSGSGKSTLMSLLLRFYDPTRGRIIIDGCDIRNYTLSSLRAQIRVVLQESFLFGVSIRDNIGYGAIEATDNEIEAAARLANAHDFIQALPEGYDTILGERGCTLSGGERQRIALARATLAPAPILILDEPTTGLDKENEKRVRQALKNVTRGRTTILITHDMRLARHANLILYFENEQIVERGTHDELLRLEGRYAAMHALQSFEGEVAAREEEIHAYSRR